MKKLGYFISICVISCMLPISSHAKNLKLLHLTFHKGCAKEIDAIGAVLGHQVDTWFIQGLPPQSFDGTSSGNVLYNIGHERAERIWNLHKDTFEQYDAIITSDTAPLSRIFLQNNFKGHLIIWVCNRFDYYDHASLDCHFPDPEFYQLFNEAAHKKNVFVVAYTQFEQAYAHQKKVEMGPLLITPCAPLPPEPLVVSSIPSHILKEETFFLPPYANEINYKFDELFNSLGIPAYCGRYHGPSDLKDFKGIISFPYAWSNLALFENLSSGLPYFVPSRAFLFKLMQQREYWHTNPDWITTEGRFDLSEWYKPSLQDVVTYFDSWEDLKRKIQTADFVKLREKTKAYATINRETMLNRWQQIFSAISQNLSD